MPFGPDSVLDLLRPRRRASRYLLAIAIVVVATLLREAADPLVHDQIPFFIYVASVVFAAWFCGRDGGILATIVAAFAGNYFFVSPRYEFALSHEDWVAMALFAVVSFFLVGFVGRWRRAENEVRAIHAQTTAVLEQLPVGVMFAAANGRLQFANSATERILGRPFVATSIAEYIRTGNYKLFRPDGAPIEPQEVPLARALAGQTVIDEEIHIQRSDGTRRIVSASASPVPGLDGRISAGVLALLDISERKRLESEMRRHADELGHANRVKDEFLSTLSHELRTPLGAILGWSEMLRHHDLDEETTRKALEAISRNARAQSMLVNDVLDLSRIVTGKLRLDLHPVDLAEVMQAAVETTNPAAAAKGVAIDVSVSPGTILVGDPDRLQQILWNLLSNSVKFTPAGGRVEASIRRVGPQVDIRVADNGIGIPPEFLPHVFERFRQHDASITRSYQSGLGLGLAIVRHLTELHGGTVRAESGGPGLGAVFTITLPVRAVFEARTDRERAVAEMSVAAAPHPSTTTLAGVRVLVVDDQIDARSLVDTVLRRFGAEVVLCDSAEAAIEAVQRKRPHVILADIGMPHMDGYEMLRRMHDLPAGTVASIPAIALTAFGGAEDRRRAFEAGYRQHVAKPVAPDQLVAAIASALGLSGVA